nr:ComEC/Rec2 family competence protein [uncultured Dyadobacter sp.]
MLPRAPFVSVVLFFAIGILSGDAMHASGHDPVAFVFAGFGAACVGAIVLYYYERMLAFGAVLALSLVLLGAGCKMWGEVAKDRQLRGIQGLKYGHYMAEVSSLPEKRENSIRFEVVTSQFRTADGWVRSPVRAMMYFPNSVVSLPRPGDRIIVRGTLQVPSAPENPEQFDYQQYLRNRGILFSAYIKADAFKILPSTAFASPYYWPAAVSGWADARFHENIGNDNAYGLVKAMLLGRRDDLRVQQVGDYVISGAVHILSVSGMHVAIIFLAISAALGWIRRWRYGNWIYLIVVALLLGFYALVTGLPPSVQRATLMCLVLVVAEVTGRKHHPVNTLAFSALIILLADPCALYDVGFQLSYLAMAGICLFYNPIYGLFEPSNRLFRFIWQVSALALAAQLATFPLGLFYFHQFPTYFWLVNPFVIIFTNILLPAALLLLMVSAFDVPPLQWCVNQVVALSARFTDWSAALPRSFPGHLVENLHLNALEVFLLYIILFSVWYTLHSRQYAYFKFSVMLVLGFASVSVAGSLLTFTAAERVSYRIRKHEVMSFKRGNRLYIVSDPAFPADTRAYDFNVRNYAITREIQDVVFVGSKH